MVENIGNRYCWCRKDKSCERRSKRNFGDGCKMFCGLGNAIQSMQMSYLGFNRRVILLYYHFLGDDSFLVYWLI